ncbi:hypothetical protein ACFP6A_06025 [Quadrisphaera sp. GCM10027208]|uniref:hypothetical protein n=1 Tax=Quadrisphaera sp. GCM10027208 TaxID=3273423 RepID=UPI00360A452F
MHPKIAKTRSRVGVAYRTGDPQAIAEASRDHAAAKIETFIERTLAAAPPLTDEQRDKLALLLRAGAPPGRPAAFASGGTTSAETGTEARPGDAA